LAEVVVFSCDRKVDALCQLFQAKVVYYLAIVASVDQPLITQGRVGKDW